MKNKLFFTIGILVLGFIALALRAPTPQEYVCLDVSDEAWNASVIVQGTCHHYLTIEGEVKTCNHENCGQCKPSTCTHNPPECRYTAFANPIEK